jgi:hypothetical protein
MSEDERLAHMCKLASVAAYVFTQPREEWIEYIRDADRAELLSQFTGLQILSEAFMALLKMHPELRPVFRVHATGGDA